MSQILLTDRQQWVLITLLIVALSAFATSCQASEDKGPLSSNAGSVHSDPPANSPSSMAIAAESESKTDFDAIYFVPADIGQVERALRPDSLLKEEQLEQYDLAIRVSSVWSEVEGALSGEGIKAIIIHHSAVDSVDWDELKDAFQTQEIVVAGIGIPGLELAKMLGDPSLFSATWTADSYTTPYYFYVYSRRISGDKTAIERLRESEWQPGKDPPAKIVIEEPVAVNYHASTDSLLGKQGGDVLFSTLRSHMLSLNDTTSDEQEHLKHWMANRYFDSAPITLQKVILSGIDEGQKLTLHLTTATVETANEGIVSVMNDRWTMIEEIDKSHGLEISLLKIKLLSNEEKVLLDFTLDLQRMEESWRMHDGITVKWFPSPLPAYSP